MATNIKKLPFPSFLLTTEYEAILYSEGISEDGEPIISHNIKGKCIFSEKVTRVIDTDGKQVELLGKVIIEGDVAPSLKNISDGVITINGGSYHIHKTYRPRNPDGTIHHTLFEVK